MSALPKARVMYANKDLSYAQVIVSSTAINIPVAVIRCPSLERAQKRSRFANLKPDTQQMRVAQAMYREWCANEGHDVCWRFLMRYSKLKWLRYASAALMQTGDRP